MSATDTTDLYYDPFDFEIDVDPYPIWSRLRDEQPLYYNERYDFYALSRFDDVERGLVDWRSYSSAKGTILELIKSGMEIPPGSIIFEDPPDHDLHRSLLSRVFTPRKMGAIEPKVREFCARSLDPLVGTGGFDFIRDLGAQMPMRTIGMLLGIPEQDQEALRDKIDDGLRLESGEMPTFDLDVAGDQASAFADYIDWRAKHPSDDLMTELLQGTFTDTEGVERRLSREEVLGYVNLVAAAGNETTTRLIGWTGKVLSEHPDQRRKLVEDRSLVPNAIEELLRYEPPSPVQARYVTQDVEHYGQVVPEGSAMLLLNAAANRDERKFADAESFDIERKIDHHLSFGYGIHFCLGAALARLEGRVALDEVLQRFPEWEVDTDNAVQARTSTVRGWEKLPVVVPS
ncbi:MAG TPA: cytochrome P450 [Acidimicrobiales bacterium]|nr:cytochrome P450 [Acidimicrobiales bacterium]